VHAERYTACRWTGHLLLNRFPIESDQGRSPWALFDGYESGFLQDCQGSGLLVPGHFNPVDFPSGEFHRVALKVSKPNSCEVQ
jgi:hypothetical protein